MSQFGFNKMFILQSLKGDKIQTGTELKHRLDEWNKSRCVTFQIVRFEVHSLQDWDIAWNSIYASIESCGNIPIIHLEMHGDENYLGIDKGTTGIIPLTEVFLKVQKANILSKNNIFLSLAVCMGLNVIKGLKAYGAMPFCGLLGSQETLGNSELLENYTIFYKSFLESLNLDVAQQALQNAGIDPLKYQLIKPEQIFINAYLGYLETYKTDDDIVMKALEVAKQGGVTFADETEEKRFVRDYRCQLLMTENEEYQHARKEFFMFDKYPEIESRFVIQPTIREFKKYAIEQGNNWLQLDRELTIDDIKGVSLGILKEIHEFCQQNGLTYSLAYGTLLGAVRHKGFIPWDDDIDIIMPRRDYQILMEKFNTTKHIQNLKFVSNELDSRYYLPYGKVVNTSTDLVEKVNSDFHSGVFVDVFPLDKLLDSIKKSQLYFIKIKLLYNILTLKNLVISGNRAFYKNLIVRVSHIILYFIPRSALIKILIGMSRKFQKETHADYVGCLCPGVYGEKEIMPSDWWNNYIDIDFEGCKFFASSDFDKILKKLYGDYMKLPPAEKQVSHHGFIAFWK